LEGLEPGAEYTYEVRVDGSPLPTTTWNPGAFTTLIPPGDLRFRVATLTDTHVGEDVAGLIGGTAVQGFSWPDPERPYWRFTNEAAVAAINASGVDFVIHKGDLTAEARPQELEDAQAIFGALEMPWYVVRGNHDHAHEGVDGFSATYDLDPTWRAFDHGRHRFLLLDSNQPGSGLPGFAEEELTWLEDELAAARAALRPTWIAMHHAASEQAEVFFTLLGADQRGFLEALAAASPAVVAVLSGHSHRNAVRASDIAPGVAFVETASVKEYPGYWTEVRVYTKGWLQISHYIDCPECRQWYALTTGMYNGNAQSIKSGRLEDRCFALPFHADLVEAPEAVVELGPDGSDTTPDGAADDDERADPAAGGSGCAVVPSGSGPRSDVTLLIVLLAGLALVTSRVT
jgi:3',5'-cyclic-AMP phosphodiesterase